MAGIKKKSCLQIQMLVDYSYEKLCLMNGAVIRQTQMVFQNWFVGIFAKVWCKVKTDNTVNQQILACYYIWRIWRIACLR